MYSRGNPMDCVELVVKYAAKYLYDGDDFDLQEMRFWAGQVGAYAD